MPKTKPKSSPIATALGSAGSTIGGPASGLSADPALSTTGPSIGALAAKQAGTQATAAAMPSNPLKPLDHGLASGHAPAEGAWVEPPSEGVSSSTLSESNESAKVGAGATVGLDANAGPLDHARVDSGGQALTTNQGVLVAATRTR